MICTCGHHMGAHRPFCRDCEFNTAGCRQFVFDGKKTVDALSARSVESGARITFLPFAKDSAIGRAYFALLAEDKRYLRRFR